MHAIENYFCQWLNGPYETAVLCEKEIKKKFSKALSIAGFENGYNYSPRKNSHWVVEYRRLRQNNMKHYYYFAPGFFYACTFGY